MADNKECNVCKKFIKSKYKPLKVCAIISAICNVLLVVALIIK